MANHDKNLVLNSLQTLPEQILDGLKQSATFKLPKNYRQIKNVVLSGMGGSNLSGRLAEALLAHDLQVPFLINADYEINSFVGRDTLFIASSYSGSTEETLHAYEQAKKAKAKIVVITKADADNKLATRAKADGYPCLDFTAEANPSGQPRLAIGYALICLIAVLRQVGVLKLSDKAILAAVKKMRAYNQKLIPEKSNNLAHKLSDQIFNKNIIIIAGPFLAGNAHILRNQFNENSKNIASYLVLPELNHYALEGMAHPTSNKSDVICLFFESALYSPRVGKRLELTKKVMAKNKIKIASAKLSGQNKLEQALEMLSLGAWLTYYLGAANHVDPIAIPWVDWFKKELK